MTTSTERRAAVKRFVERWTGRGDERSDCQSFWIELLQTLFDVSNGSEYIEFEKRVLMEHIKYIDAYIWPTKVLIEQKSLGVDLTLPNRQSGDTFLTPYEQAKQYANGLPHSEHPRWIITCNFAEFRIYDTETPRAEPLIIALEDLERNYTSLEFLLDGSRPPRPTEMEISIEAGKIVGLLYDALLQQYHDPTDPRTLHNLNVLCVRLVFCLYAEDADIFEKDLFYEYMSSYSTDQMWLALTALFQILDTPTDRRTVNDSKLNAFPYVNGGLFSDRNIEIPAFTDEIRELLLQKASAEFDWSGISPTIFGAVFESTLNPETRRTGGMHYTSIENIHKVIEPLFLDDLRNEFDNIRALPSGDRRKREIRSKRLLAFQEKLASLNFLDPACGSGNFLTETYLSLRRLENKMLYELDPERGLMSDENWSPVKVSIAQFYGIEINDFAVTVAKTALWIAESQMLKETEDILNVDLNFLPLRSYNNIIKGNALQIDWKDIVPQNKLSYIMGNPPFAGARVMNAEQKRDLNNIFDGWRNVGNLDYVACWYKKAADMMRGTPIRTALVSTNSITQGDSVAILWKPLMQHELHIDFAYRTFRWDSESRITAHVYCVIIGFSCMFNTKQKVIYTDEQQEIAENINGYLVNGANIFVESRTTPLCIVPEISIGNQPIDDGNYLFTEDEMLEFIRKEPASERYFKPWYGAQEFINQKPRYCLWLGDCTPHELHSMPECLKRVDAVHEFRSKSKRTSTLRLAMEPTRFQVENMPRTDYVVVPRVSSELRRYIPMGFMSPEILVSDAVHIIPNASLYHFGVLTSYVHMAWMRAVAGRLKSDYRYSKDIVYNNFPWPNPTAEQKKRIEQTAKKILNVRASYPDSNLAELYDNRTMPEDLREAHKQNNLAVMVAYGFSNDRPPFPSESEIVAKLMKMYQQLAAERE